jgi:hypothetical protein
MNQFIVSGAEPKLRYSSKVKSYGVFIIALLCQIFCAHHFTLYKPALGIVYSPPSLQQIQLLSMGDEAFYYRWHALELQQMGDSYGRVTPLHQYDYSILYQWLNRIDALAPLSSHWLPTIAAYYFVQTQNRADTIYIVHYLYQRSLRDLSTQWWWLAQAIYIANHRLNRPSWALNMAYELASIDNNRLPAWAKQMPAILAASMGKYDHALVMMRELMDNSNRYTKTERAYMQYFIEQQLKALEHEKGVLK